MLKKYINNNKITLIATSPQSQLLCLLPQPLNFCKQLLVSTFGILQFAVR